MGSYIACYFTQQGRNSQKSPTFIDFEGFLPYREEPAPAAAAACVCVCVCVPAPVIPVHSPASYFCKINGDVILTS